MGILLVDDSKVTLFFLEDALREAGHGETHLALSVEEAFGILEKEGEAIRLVVLDVLMPGTDGLEACRRLRADPRWCHLPVIIISGAEDLGYLEEAFKIGAVDFITKPMRKGELVARVGAALRLQEERDQFRECQQELARLNDELATVSAKLARLVSSGECGEG